MDINKENQLKQQDKYNKKYPTSTFPYSVIEGLAGEFTKTYCDILEIPPEFMYISFLTCLGSLLARSLTISTEIKPQPRLYTLLLGQSADERKSTALIETIRFFEHTLQKRNVNNITQEQTQFQLHTCLGAGSAEGLAKKLKDENLLLCYDEFKAFISKATIRNSTLLQCVNTLFESNTYENQTSTSEIKIKNGRLSLLAASTMQTYESAWHSSFTAIGFNNRLFIVPGAAQREYSLPPKIANEEKYYLSNELYKILDFVGEFRELDITKGARELFHEWYMNRPHSIHSKRLDGYALRFMELLAVNKMKEIIDESIVNNAIELMDWQFEVRQLYDPIDADNIAAKMEEKIRRALSHKSKKTGATIPLTDRGLKQMTNANRTGLYFYGLALKNLQESAEISFNGRAKTWSLTEKE